MKLAFAEQIRKIDSFAINTLGIPAEVLMGRSGSAVAREVRSLSGIGDRVVILAGKGNNGGDGYAAACELLADRDVLVYDVFSAGQKSPEGNHYLFLYKSLGGRVLPPEIDDGFVSNINGAAVIVDAIFGTGASSSIPEHILSFAEIIGRSPAKRVAVDVPLGVNADDGSVCDGALAADVTVALSYLKPGLLSYPAKAICGRVVLDTIGLPSDIVEKNIDFKNHLFDFASAVASLPDRPDNSSKGTFGRALLITGSREYTGAGLLTLEAALRGGAGYITHICSPEEKNTYAIKFPEVIYKTDLAADSFNIEKIKAISEASSETLIGSGCGLSEGLADLTCELIKSEGGPLVIDADAINSIAKYKSREVFLEAKRKIILTPHPLEFSRLSGIPLEEIRKNRISVAKTFAKKYGVILVLKGAATLTTDGEHLYINSSGSSALAKAGSGDVLAGLLSSVLAYHKEPLVASALSVYLHGLAGDNLSEELSGFGVTPSDLPLEISRIMRKIEKSKGELI